MTGPVDPDAWMAGRRELAMLASYMADDGWSIGEIVRMIENPGRYADLYVLARAEHQLDSLDTGGS